MSGLAPVDAAGIAPLLGGCDYGEAFVEQSESSSIRYEDSRVEDIVSSAEKGLAMRFLRKSSQGHGVETLLGSAQATDATAAAALRRGLLGAGQADRKASPTRPLSLWKHPVRRDPGAISLDEKISLLSSIDRDIRSGFPHIRQVSLSYAERRRDIVILNSEGAHCREERTTVLFAVNVIAERDGILQTGSEVIGGLRGWELLEDTDPRLAARGAAARALEKLEAPKAKAGEMPIVLSSSAGGTFIHEAIGHSLEVDHVQEGSSPHYIGKRGKQVAPENITVIDDPTLPFYRGSFRFDDEGIEAKPTALVKKGMLVDYLYDRVSALKEGRPSNGHGRRESFHYRPIPRMSNLYIAPGADDPKDILRNLKNGIFVTRMGGGQVNTATGEFVFEVDEGFWVENGKIMHLVRDANLLGIGPEILMSIDKVGWDMGWGIGTCGKDGQGVPVGDGQPTLGIPKILIGGRND